MLALDFNRKPSTVITVVYKHPAPLVWRPQIAEKVIFFSEQHNRFRTALYMGLWSERQNPNNPYEASPYLEECMPYCQTPEKQVVRAFLLDMETGYGTYGNVELIGEFNQGGIDWAHEQNRDLAEREAIERLEAFGEVEAVA